MTFRTPPEDSTGVPHILEHSVLCGSRKFPVKEPFVDLMKGSLNTFLNAFTYPDRTCYPVASQNLKVRGGVRRGALRRGFTRNWYWGGFRRLEVGEGEWELQLSFAHRSLPAFREKTRQQPVEGWRDVLTPRLFLNDREDEEGAPPSVPTPARKKSYMNCPRICLKYPDLLCADHLTSKYAQFDGDSLSEGVSHESNAW